MNLPEIRRALRREELTEVGVYGRIQWVAGNERRQKSGRSSKRRTCYVGDSPEEFRNLGSGG